MAQASAADLLGRLQRWLAQHRPRFAAGLNPPATAADLANLERALGIPVPAELRELLGWHDGQGPGFIGCLEESWLLMGTRNIADAKPALDADAAATGWHKTWLPFLDNDAGDYLCLDTSTSPAAVRAFCLGSKDHKIAAPSLAAWLADFVTHVEAGKYAEEPERGAFMRSRS